MSEFVVVIFFIIISMLLGAFLCKELVYPDMEGNEFYGRIFKNLIYPILIIGWPCLCANVYVLSPFNSFTSLLILGILGFVISIFLYPILTSKNQENLTRTSKTKIISSEIIFLYLSLIIPYSLFYMTSVIIFGALL